MPLQTYSVLTTDGFVASSSAAAFRAIGFRASSVRVDNLGTAPLYVKFDVATWTSCAASTSDLCVSSCANQNRAVFEFGDRVPVSTITLWATSTAAGVIGYGISALGQ